MPSIRSTLASLKHQVKRISRLVSVAPSLQNSLHGTMDREKVDFWKKLKFVKTSDGNSPPRQTTTLATGEWGTVCVLWRENTIELP